MRFTADDVRHLLRPLEEAGRIIRVVDALGLAYRLFETNALDVEIVPERLKDGRVARIGHLSGRDCPAVKAWNRMVDGAALSPEALGIFEATSRHAFRRVLGEELMACRTGDDAAEVDLEALLDRLPGRYDRLLDCLTHPVVDPLDPEQRRLSLPRFTDKKNRSAKGTADTLAIGIHGWSRLELAVRRQGLGWQRASRLDYLKTRRPAEQLTLASFVGSKRPRIIEDAAVGLAERAMIDRTIEKLRDYRKALDHYPGFGEGRRHIGGAFLEIDLADYPAYRFLASDGEAGFASLVILDAESRDLVGGCVIGTTWVDPTHRGCGLGKAIHIADRQEALGLTAPTHFSRSGYEARCAYHRDAVLAAHAAGRRIHPDNLARYADLLAATGLETPSPG